MKKKMDTLEKNLDNISCPICNDSFPCCSIDTHVNQCLDSTKLSENKNLPILENTKPINNRKLSQSEVKLSTMPNQPTMSDAKNQATKKGTTWSFLKSPNVIHSNASSAKRMKLNETVQEIDMAKNYNNEGGHRSENSHQNVSSLKNSPSSLPKTVDCRPLAERMRPTSLDDYVGQEKVVGRNAALRKLLELSRISSMILWGPPGCGKTTLARLIANKCRSDTCTAWRFVPLSAATSGIADVKDCIKIAKNEATMFKRKTVLFIDEIHRFNKLQQDAFLPHVEDGTVVLVGATTENPSFHVNNALLSRCTVVVLEKLSTDDVCIILRKAIKKLGMQVSRLDYALPSKEEAMVCGADQSGELPEKDASLEDDVISRNTQTTDAMRCDAAFLIESTAIQCIAALCDGDARSALNTLQMALDAKTSSFLQNKTETFGSSSSKVVITEQDVKEVQGRAHVLYDRAGMVERNLLRKCS